jgi:hypothetical protein
MMPVGLDVQQVREMKKLRNERFGLCRILAASLTSSPCTRAMILLEVRDILILRIAQF